MPTTPNITISAAFREYIDTGSERYGGQDMGRIKSRIERFLQREENKNLGLSSLYRLDEFVLASQGDKRRSGEMALRFYDFLKRRYGHAFDSELREVHLIDNPT